MFLFRLALQLGQTVAQLQANLSAGELVEWMAFYSIDPWGGYRTDLAAATIASTLANINSDGKTVFNHSDFMPFDRLPDYVDDTIDHQYISDGFKQFFNALKRRG